MRNFTIYLAIFLCSLASKIFAQEAEQTFEFKAKEIALKIEKITISEKQALKELVEAVNVQQEKGNITKQEADEKKLQLATTSANNIESRVSLEQDKLTQLVKDKVEGKLISVDTTKNYGKFFSIGYNNKKKKDTIQKSERRTTSQFIFAAGVNNLVTNERVANSDFRYYGSHFYEWGFSYNTRLAKNSNIAHLKYGMSLMYNNLRPTDNRYFQTLGNQTQLVTSGISLKDSRLRNVNLVIPVHFELDFSKTKTVNDRKIFNSHEGFRLGLGGFAGVNIKTKQIIKYNDAFGNKVETKTKGNYNVNDFVYGVSSYIGYGETSLYVKYDLNPLFTNNTVNQNNISLGVRFDFN